MCNVADTLGLVFSIEREPPFRSPALVLALDGWVNAGMAGTLAAAAMADRGPVVARFDPDALFDFRMVRPVVEFENGVIREVEWPRLDVVLAACDERDVLVMSGTEPNWGWARFSKSVVALAEQLGVRDYVGVGGVPWATPHTRATTVMATAGNPGLLPPGAGVPEGRLRVPAAAVSVVEWAMTSAGVPATGFWARVPNYVGGDYPAAAVALIEHVAAHLNVTLPHGELAGAAVTRREELDEVAGQRPDVQSLITQLEQLHDSSQVVSGEELAAEIERFLRDQ